MFYLHTKFDDSRFSRSRNISWAQKFKMGHMAVTTPIKVVCHPCAGAWFSLPLFKIWPL